MPDFVLPKKANDLRGKLFGRLTAIRPVGKNKRRDIVWECVCECGNSVNAPSNALKTSNTGSCGCLHRSIVTTHGKSGGGRSIRSPEYTAWMGMNMRCHNRTGPDWDNYGGRGITVCDRWTSFENFLEDVGPKPSPSHSLDRWPDYNGNYEPGNVRWATKKEQDRNKRNNRRFTFNGETLCVTEWSERTGISPCTIVGRIKNGWPIEKAMTVPPSKRNKRAKVVA